MLLAAVVMGGVPSKPAEFNCVFDYGGMLSSEETQLIRIAGNYIRAKSKAELVVFSSRIRPQTLSGSAPSKP